LRIVALFLTACAASSATRAPEPAPSPPATSVVAVGTPPGGEPLTTVPPPGDSGAEPLEARDPSRREKFGRATVLDDPPPIGLRPATAEPLPSRIVSDRFREERKINVGVSHLAVGDLSPDETRLLAFSSGERALRVYDRKSGKLLSQPLLDFIEQWGRGDVLFWPRPGHEPPLAVVADPRGLSLRDTVTGAERSVLSSKGSWQIRFSANREVLMANLPFIPQGGAQSSELSFYRLTPDDRLETELVLGFEERVDSFDLDATHGRLAVLFYPSGDLEVFDLRERRGLWGTPAPEYSSSVDISPDDRFVAVGGSSVQVHGLDNPSRPARYSRFDNNINTVRFSPDMALLAVSSYDGRIRTFRPSVERGELTMIQTLRHGGTANVYSLTFARDARTLVSTSGDRTVRIWSR
jgi:WD40 repeat protein